MKSKEYFLLISSIIVFLALFWFINPQKFLTYLLAFNLSILLLIVALFMLDLSLRTLRWWVILHSHFDAIDSVPFKALISPTFSSSLLNLIIPGRVGELIRLYSLRDQYNVRYSVGLSVIVVEQVINIMSLIMAASIGLGLIVISGIELENDFLNFLIPYAFLGSLIMLLGIFMLFIVEPKRFLPLFKFLPEKIFVKVEKLVGTFSQGLNTMKGKFYIFWIALASSFSIWIIEGIIIWFITLEILSPNFEFPIALFSSTIGNFNFMFPILPGAAGTYEFFLSSILKLSPNWPEEGAVTVAVIDRLIKTVILAIVGGYPTISMGYSKFMKYKDEKPEIEKNFDVKSS